MTLFQILTRRVAAGKMKVTRKLLDRVRRETGGKCRSIPPKPCRSKPHNLARSRCAALVAALTLTICLVSGRAATGAPPGESPTVTIGYSAAALFNQGNSYARNGKPGLAILNYERAQWLAPNDADAAANLHFVRAQAGLPDPPANWIARGLSYARPNTLAWLGSFGLALVGVSMLLIHVYPGRHRIFRSLASVGALSMAVTIASAITLWPRLNVAVIIAREAPAFTSPVSGSEPAFKLREGETVTMRAEHQGFALVQTLAGRSGWVARADLSLVVPRSGDGPPSHKRT